MSTPAEWQVYSLHDPRTKVIRYVGITAVPLAVRFSQHLFDRGNARKFEWVEELRREGAKPIMNAMRARRRAAQRKAGAS